MSKVIILNAGRVGGTLLQKALNSHSQLKITGEVLNLNRDSIPFPARSILEEIIGTLPERRDKKSNWNVPAKYIDKLFEIYDGFKLLYYELNEEIIKYLKNREDLKIIHLKRNNLLEQHVSQIVAHKTLVFHIGKERRHLFDKITLSPKSLEKNFRCQMKDWNRHDKLFGNPYSVFYEDMIQNWDETLSELQGFIGLRKEKLPVLQKKVIQNPIQEVVYNYRSLYYHFKNTEYKKFFKSPLLHL